MNRDRLRAQIAHEAAQMLRHGRAVDAHAARVQAARRIVRGWTPKSAIPRVGEVLARTAAAAGSDRVALPEPYATFRMLLAPLAHIRMPPQTHPEGDALYHSLQTFVAVADAAPYDLELMLAALLHEIGRGLDPFDPLPARDEAVADLVSARTQWFLSELPDARRRLEGELGARATRRLARHPDADALGLLARSDRDAVVCGAAVPELDEALALLAAADDEAGEELQNPTTDSESGEARPSRWAGPVDSPNAAT